MLAVDAAPCLEKIGGNEALTGSRLVTVVEEAEVQIGFVTYAVTNSHAVSALCRIPPFSGELPFEVVWLHVVDKLRSGSDSNGSSS